MDIDLPGEAYIPRTYVPDMRLKIDLYRRLARVSDHAELADFRAELIDRFGQPLPLVEQLLAVAELRIAAHQWSVQSIHLENQYRGAALRLGAGASGSWRPPAVAGCESWTLKVPIFP